MFVTVTEAVLKDGASVYYSGDRVEVLDTIPEDHQGRAVLREVAEMWLDFGWAAEEVDGDMVHRADREPGAKAVPGGDSRDVKPSKILIVSR